MKSTMTTKLVVLMFVAVCLGTASAEQTKKKTLTVTVEENEGCANGISVSDQSWGDRHLCADTPNVAAGYLRPYVGQAVEIEAKWSFTGDPKTDSPDSLNKVLKVAGSKVIDPCAISKIGLIAGIVYAASAEVLEASEPEDAKKRSPFS
jgi:hypothetical protein